MRKLMPSLDGSQPQVKSPLLGYNKSIYTYTDGYEDKCATRWQCGQAERLEPEIRCEKIHLSTRKLAVWLRPRDT